MGSGELRGEVEIGRGQPAEPRAPFDSADSALWGRCLGCARWSLRSAHPRPDEFVNLLQIARY